jgi:predicted GNAT family N-acyltransferase
MIEIKKLSFSSAEFEDICSIRHQVFVVEQKVDPKEEFDEFEKESVHFLAFYSGKIAGTCRYRKTDKGIKLERFAVLPAFRRKGIAYEMVKTCLKDLDTNEKIYLHAQIDAIPLYKKAGFKAYGPEFYECEIAHFAMELKP